MGLGRLLNRDKVYEVTDTTSGTSQTFTIVDPISPDWAGRRYRGGMGIPGAWRSSLLLSGLLGSVPWNAYRERGRSPVEKIEPTPPLLDQPNPDETRMNTLSAWALDLIWEGNAVGIIADRSSDGWPTAVLPVPAESVFARRVGPGANAGGLPVGSVEYSIGGRLFDPSDVFHIKGPAEPGSLRGMGVLELHLNNGALELADEQARQARNITRSGVPTGVLKSTNSEVTRNELKQIKADWVSQQRDRTIAALNGTTEFQPISWNPEEMQLIEARKFSLHELALIFGVPLSFLGADQATRTYSNIEQESLNLIKFSLGDLLARFEQTFTAHLPRGTWAKANLDSVLRADTKTRYEAHQIGLQAGFLTRDEVRDIEDLPPMPPSAEPAASADDNGEGTS